MSCHHLVVWDKGVTYGELAKDEVVEQTFEALMGTLIP